MPVDLHANAAYSVLVNAPGIAGLSVSVTPGTGGRFVANANATLRATGTVLPLEIVRVTAVAGDTLTITRLAETDHGASAAALNAAVGWEIFQSATAKTFTDIEALALGGTVTSVGLTAPADLFTVGSSPVVGAGTLTLTKVVQAPNLVYAGPTSGGNAAPTFRALVNADIAGLNATSATLAASATVLATPRAINGVNFDGSAAITVAAAAGTLTGNTLAAGVTASSLTSVGTLATLTVTATIAGSVNGNAATATALQNVRTINTVNFDGTANITVTAAATTLTGATLNATVLASSLTSVGILAAPHMTSPVVDSGGLTITSGSLVVSAGSGNSITGVATAGGATLWTWTPGAHTAVTAEFHHLYKVGVTTTITGGYALQRFVRFGIPTITAGTAQTVATSPTVAIEGAPVAAGSALITRPLALLLQSGGLGLDGNGGLSTTTGPIFQATGTWITGGNATTTKPYVLIEPTGTTSTAWSTAGTGLGINAATGFTGRFVDFQLVAVSKFSVDVNGTVLCGNITANNLVANVAATINNSLNASVNLFTLTQSVAGSGNRVLLTATAGAHTGQTIAESNDVLFNLTASLAFTTGAGTVAALRAFRIRPRTYTAGTAATTFTQAATFAVDGPPIAGSNVVFTNPAVAIWCAGDFRLDSNVANGSVAALFTAASAPTGANTAIQEWFRVVNASGVVRFIPAW